jgi:hypothetical protein
MNLGGPMQLTESSTRNAPIAAAALSLACIALGAALGLMTNWLLSTPTALGSSRITDAVVEILVGGGIGFITALYLARDLSTRARWWSALIAVLLTAATVWSMTLTSN